MNKVFVGSFVFLTVVLTTSVCFAYNNIISGDGCSDIDIHDSIIVVLTDTGVGVSHFYPRIYRYMGYGGLYPDPVVQRIFSDSFSYDPSVNRVLYRHDYAGNSILEPYCGDPENPDTSVLPGEYKITIMADAQICMVLDGIPDSTSYPISSYYLPQYVQKYLESTDSIQSNDQSLQDYAESLVVNSRYEVGAVCRIMDWIADSVTYDSTKRPRDALWIFDDPDHRTTCLGIARLAIAFLRSAGIPLRYIILRGRTILDSQSRDPYWYRADRCRR